MRMDAVRLALAVRPHSHTQPWLDAIIEVEAYEKIAEEAARSVDIGDEINRCRICWETWGAHDKDCPVALAKEIV